MSERDVFTAALRIADPAERRAYLDQACSDEVLRRRIESLLGVHAGAGDFLERPAAAPRVGDSNPDGTSLHGLARGSEPGEDENALDFLQPSSKPGSVGRLGHYEVLAILGKGGFGIVLRAFDELLQRVVAVKVMAPHIAATSPARRRFLREARSSAQVRHENVVAVYNVAEQPIPYLVMEFIAGETVQQRLDRTGPLDAREVLRIGRQVAEGLAGAHATGLIHRDVKPANILLESGSDRVKITDFGLARAADDASLTHSGIIVGTPLYMAPEQARGETIDHRADLFSLGSVLYAMCCGRPPFRAPTTLAVLKRVAEDEPRAIREIIPEVPQWLCDIIAKLHAKNPDDRFRSAREVADVLGHCESQFEDFSRIPQTKPAAGRRKCKWAAAAALLLFLILALTGIGSVCLLFWDKGLARIDQSTPDPSRHDGPDFTNSLGMQFKLIPAGKFTMGSSKEEIDHQFEVVGDNWGKDRLPSESPDHPVEITKPFHMCTTEVTVRQFRQFVEEEDYRVGDDRWQRPKAEQQDNHPVDYVSWQNAVDFCKWLSKRDGKTYRLPTEAEWEYCCRAGRSGTRYCYGNDEARLEDYAWYARDSRGGMHAVGKKKPNEWGLFDMHGNAWEWCQDSFAFDFYKSSPVNDPIGPGTGLRVVRGGGAGDDPVQCRSSFRNFTQQNEHHKYLGFRVLLSPVAP